MNTYTLDRYIAHFLITSVRRNYDIKGAPFKIGDLVIVSNNPNNDETFDYTFSGRKGIVEYFEYDCGCGQNFPNDPMIGVKFNNGKSAEFWKEELKLIKS